MSVIVNGMDMPKNCAVCPLKEKSELKLYCKPARDRFIGRWDTYTKPKWCPLKEDSDEVHTASVSSGGDK